ncbi:sigma-70 family RNA polymerase sigma factor [Cupriavidus sp. SW-Y-13]|uniref:sigma-70 family RNA polymerase sigma factor n=1 Tax=Cupriavidus sp. SW-Y-13 TaxID=2653854 RepID=UPI001365D537|nr:sigma-70 family RNA polymerase sigma factor [Cupriavidus sp. SW-Y-13]MWL90514.1 sigma-70 family RNA polymerase sigma factor [Cupriavidus sp. SW-Y-13]
MAKQLDTDGDAHERKPGDEAGHVTEAALWRRYRETGAQADRDVLIRHYLPYAQIVAATYYGRRTHDEIEFEEYLQFATVGLVESVDRYAEDRGAQFKTFASRRMHGAILNGLERLTEKQQQIALRVRLRQERMKEVKAAARAAVEEAGESIGAGKDAPFRYLAEVGIGVALTFLLEGTGLIENDALASAPTSHYYGSLEYRQLQQRLRHFIGTLSSQEQTVIRSHYLQEIRFEEIATTLGVTKGRIAQIHRAALDKLRKSLKSHQSSDTAW